jgi:hypothetical protein
VRYPAPQIDYQGSSYLNLKQRTQLGGRGEEQEYIL